MLPFDCKEAAVTYIPDGALEWLDAEIEQEL